MGGGCGPLPSPPRGLAGRPGCWAGPVRYGRLLWAAAAPCRPVGRGGGGGLGCLAGWVGYGRLLLPAACCCWLAAAWGRGLPLAYLQNGGAVLRLEFFARLSCKKAAVPASKNPPHGGGRAGDFLPLSSSFCPDQTGPECGPKGWSWRWWRSWPIHWYRSWWLRRFSK